MNCPLAENLYIGNNTPGALSFFDDPNLNIPGFSMTLDTYLVGVKSDLTGLRVPPGANDHVNWRFTQGIRSNSITATVGGQALPGPSFGTSEFLGYINDLTPEQTQSLKLNEALPLDASLTMLPATGLLGQTLDLSIVGNGTHFVDGISTLYFSATGITVNSLIVTSETIAIANVSIAKDAPAFPRDVYIATSDEVAGAYRAFAITPTITNFSAFSSRAETSSTDFELVSNFTLGTGSNGINPSAQEVVLSLGTYRATIPANSFHLTSKGDFVYEGTVNGVSLEARITPSTAMPNSYTFRVEGNRSVNLSPVIELIIGNDMGLGVVTLDN